MRIEIPVHFDLWMRGAQYGRVVEYRKDGAWLVKMDHWQVKRRIVIMPEDQNFCRIL